MVGLKTFWITISALLMLASCVPQSKKSECGPDEAFNTSLRTCVPVVQGPGQFINITSVTPTTPYQRYRLSSVTMPFRIFFTNPYARPYTIRWTHNYNGVETILSNAQLDQLTLSPISYSSQIGTHTLTVDMLDSSNGSAVVDSHVFIFNIDNTPKPTITANGPSAYTQETTPLSPAQTYSIDISNNNASTLGYRVHWKLFYQSGGEIAASTWLASTTTADQAFADANPANSHTNSVIFDPSRIGMGRFFLRGRIVFSGSSIVEERTWDVVVKHPSFGVISSANLPLPSITTNAYHDVGYDDFINGFADSTYTKADYCVTVSDPDGTYPNGGIGDSTLPYKNVLVRYYRYASDPVSAFIYEGKTDPAIAKNFVCFSDAPLANQNALVWNDGPSTTAYPRELIARVFDEQTLEEMCIKETCSSVTYPVKWNVTVNPKNIGPQGTILAAQAGDNLTYTSSGLTTRNATVTQDSNFIIRFRLTDESLPIGWDPAVNTNKFRFTGRLMRGATILDSTSCVKAFTDATAGPNYLCTFNIPSFDAYGGSGPNAPGAHTIVVTPEDADSQVPTSVGQTGTSLIWNLNVTEAQTRPTIALNAVYDESISAPYVSPIAEKKTIRFYIGVTDAERDTYNLFIEKCTDSTCATRTNAGFNVTSTTQSYPSTPSTLYNANSSITYTLREDEVGSAASGPVYFRVSLNDIPTTVAGLPARDGSGALPYLDISVNVSNVNDTPVINPARLTFPLVGNVTPYSVFGGNTFSILTVGGALPYANAISDTSSVSSEQITSYQWFVKPAASATWQAINGGTTPTLRWTPGPELSGNHHLSLCVADGFPRTAADHSNGVCTGNYLVNVKSNISKLSNTGVALTGDVAIHHVPAERVAYVAFISDSADATGKYINVEKFAYKADGTLNTSGMRLARFRASGAALIANTVKDLSITASDTHVYVAYLSDTTGIPGSFNARVRLININNSTQGTKTHADYADSTRKFDFNYTAYTVTPTCAGGNCVWDPIARTVTFNGAALGATDEIRFSMPTAAVPPEVAFPTSVVAPTPTGSICANCDATNQALTFANALNSYGTTDDLQGLTATASAGIVTIHGLEAASFYDGTDVIIGMGKILYNTNNNRWYLPVINATLSGADQNKVQILSAATGTVTPVTSSNVLSQSGFENVVKVDNAWSPSDQMLLGYITTSGSAVKVINLNRSGSDYLPPSSPASPTTVFSSGITDFKVRPSPGASNPNVFVAAKNTLNFWSLARLPNTLASLSVVKTIDATLGANASDDTILTGDVVELDLQPAAPQAPATSTDEARVVVISDSGTATNYNTHLFRWYTAITPGDTLASNGESLELDTEEVAPTSKLATFPFAAVAMGDDGGTVGENTNFTMGVVRVNTSGTGIAEVQIFNSEIESIQSTARDATGYFHPPYIK